MLSYPPSPSDPGPPPSCTVSSSAGAQTSVSVLERASERCQPKSTQPQTDANAKRQGGDATESNDNTDADDAGLPNVDDDARRLLAKVGRLQRHSARDGREWEIFSGISSFKSAPPGSRLSCPGLSHNSAAVFVPSTTSNGSSDGPETAQNFEVNGPRGGGSPGGLGRRRRCRRCLRGRGTHDGGRRRDGGVFSAAAAFAAAAASACFLAEGINYMEDVSRPESAK